jgi:hypothetical protein
MIHTGGGKTYRSAEAAPFCHTYIRHIRLSTQRPLPLIEFLKAQSELQELISGLATNIFVQFLPHEAAASLATDKSQLDSDIPCF